MPDPPTLLERYRLMWTMRCFEEACAEGIMTGELRGELHLGVGQEGIAAGMVGALRLEDWVVSAHRSHLHAIAKAVPLIPVMAEVYERATGLSRGKGGHIHLFDPERRFSNTGIVGSSLPVALGHAYAARLAGTDEIAVGITGDGGANTGQFHETMNMAAIWKLPLVVLVENNRYAISVPADEVIAGSGVAERATAYGAWGRRVDGTDVEAMAAAFGEAAHHARSGAGPALLEATCYRFSGHYEGDPDHYRSPREKREMLERGDPIAIAGRRLVERGVAGEAQLSEMEREARSEIATILLAVRESPAPDPAEAFTDVFAEAERWAG
ncbi:MAG: thiamine pyrophosphate-dependent dehydrogenase E1 component subunit alpha [Actinobacteria bacterium]|nr:thiamine pyrophosphate-dependent dehydrogenase E1 component subunit alpha [Actinomycetota bacterium]